VYAPVKTFVVRFSRSLALEARGTGVHVTALCPGFTYSEFHDVLGVRAEVSKVPRWMWRDAGVVAREGYDAVMKGQVVKVNGFANELVRFLCWLLPAGAIRAISPAAALKRKAMQARGGEGK
jgi:short-subunit dehydrogenase